MGRSSASISVILIMAAINLVTLAAPYTEGPTTISTSQALTHYDIVTQAGITFTTNLITLMLTTNERPFIRTYYPIPTIPSPSSGHASDVQCTVTVTQNVISDSGMVACNTRQPNTVVGVVGGFIGGSIFGFVLAVLVTAITAILITKHHKKVKRYYNQSRSVITNHASSRALPYPSSARALVADQQEPESIQSYQHPLTLSIADDDDGEQPDYDYGNNDQQPVIELTQCPAYRSTSQY